MAKAQGSQKTGGRKKGVPNKATASMRELVKDLMSGYSREQFEADLKIMKPKDRVDAYLSMMSFVLPKPQAVAIDLGDKTVEEIDKRLEALSLIYD